MELLRIGLCDDEQRWLEKAQKIIEQYAGKMGYQIKLTCFQSQEEILSYEGEALEVVFMDIELEGASGIQVAAKLNQRWRDCAVVYVTNYLFYATETYQTDHIYFVLKEQFEERIPQVFEKIIKLRTQCEKKWKFEVIGGASREVLLSPRDVLYFEREKRRTKIHTVLGGDMISGRKSVIWKRNFLTGDLSDVTIVIL